MEEKTYIDKDGYRIFIMCSGIHANGNFQIHCNNFDTYQQIVGNVYSDENVEVVQNILDNLAKKYHWKTWDKKEL